jgi:hypothetical protein
MMKTNSDLANKSIEQILELSVDAHIQRRGTVKDSPEFQKLTQEITTCGEALALLTGVQQQEKSYAGLGPYEGPPALHRVS